MKKTKSRLQSSLFIWSLIISVSGLTDLKAQDQITLNNSSGNPIGLLVDAAGVAADCARTATGASSAAEPRTPATSARLHPEVADMYDFMVFTWCVVVDYSKRSAWIGSSDAAFRAG